MGLAHDYISSFHQCTFIIIFYGIIVSGTFCLNCVHAAHDFYSRLTYQQTTKMKHSNQDF